MRQLQLITEDLENRAALMGRMLARLDVDVEELACEALGTRLRAVANICRGCRQIALCRRWIESEAGDTGYRDFCLNAAVFDVFCRH